jgi:hypothetical protein
MRYTYRPIEWDDLLREKLGEKYEPLRARAKTLFNGDLDLVIVTLNSLRSTLAPREMETAASGQGT